MPVIPIDPLLQDLRARLEALYGERLVRLVLYGSYARGEATEDSDVDVLVVLSGDVRPSAEVFRMSEIAFQVGLEHGVLVSVMAMSERRYRSGASALARNVRSEGQVV